MKLAIDHALDRGDYFLVPFDALAIELSGKCSGNLWEGAARIYRCGTVEIEIGDPPWNGVDDNNRTDLMSGYAWERALHQMLVRAYKQEHADVIMTLSGLRAVA